MIVGDFGEEEVVCYVPIGDMVHSLVDPKTVVSVDCLRGALNEIPTTLLVHLNLFVLMLEVCDDHHPEALEQQRHIVVFQKGVRAIVA